MGLCMRKNLLIFALFLAGLELFSGYFLSMQSAYFGTGYNLSSFIRLSEKLGIISLERFKSQEVKAQKPPLPESATTTSGERIDQLGFEQIANLPHCPRANLTKNILVPTQYNPHKLDKGLHVKYKVQFSDTPIFSGSFTSEDRKKHFIIIIAGGSEIMGYSHGESKVHITLQKLLRKKFNTENITVLNSGNIAQFLSDDIAFFHQVGLNLNPDLYILHTGNNDLLYSESFFKYAENKGYTYDATAGVLSKYSFDFNENENLPLLRTGSSDCTYLNENTLSIVDSRPTSPNKEHKIFDELPPHASLATKKFVSSLNNFLNRLDRLDVNFLVGIEGYNERAADKIEPREILGVIGEPKRRWAELKEITSTDARIFNFNGSNQSFEWYDLNHTKPVSANSIAGKYYELVLLNFQDQLDVLFKE